MKKLRKVAAMLMAVCLMTVCFSFTALAADGSLQFTDPSAAAGENVTVSAKIRSGEAPIGDGKVTVTYDTQALEFISGENATGGDGTIELSATGDGSVAELSYTMEFKALKEGEATLTATEYTAYLYSDEQLNLELGTSTVTVTPGDGETPAEEGQTEDTQVTGETTSVKIDGKNYTVVDEIPDALVPEGFTSVTYKIEGADHNVLVQETSGMHLVYLQGEDGEKEFFLYDEETGAYSPFEKIDIFAGNYIMLLNDTSGVKIPTGYKSTTISLSEGGPQFPAWQNIDNQDFYVVYALNSEGTKSLYQYDSVEKTYQRFAAPKAEEAKKSKGFLGKITDTLKDQIDKVVIIAGLVFLILLAAIITAAVKLHHRNQELDDLYDQYGLDSDEEDHYKEGSKAGKIAGKGAALRKEESEDYDEADDEFDLEAYEDDDFSDEDFDDEDPDFDSDEDSDEDFDDGHDLDESFEEFTDDDFDDSEDDFSEDDDEDSEDDDFDDFDFDDFDDDEDDEDDEDDFQNTRKATKSGRKKKTGRSHTDDSDFKVDFIDLDD